MGVDRLHSREIHEEFMDFFLLKKSEFLEGTVNSFMLKVVFTLFVLLIAKEAFKAEPNIMLLGILIPLAAGYVIVFAMYFIIGLMNKNVVTRGFASVLLTVLVLLIATFALSF